MKDNLKHIFENNKIFLFGTSLFAVGFLTSLALYPKTEVVNTKQDLTIYKALSEKMDNIQAQIGKVNLEIKKPQDKVDLTSITKEISRISGNLDSVKSDTNNVLAKSNRNNNILINEIKDVKEKVVAIKGSSKETKYVDAKQLPFEILSIDVVQEVPVISIRYHFENFDLEKGDKIAGWKIRGLKYNNQIAEFINDKNEHVKISLQNGVA